VVSRRLFAASTFGLVTALAACSAIIGTRDLTLEASDAGPSGLDGTTPTTDGATGPATDGSSSDASGDAPTGDAACSPSDLLTDSLNCGTCGHSCLGGACSAGKCQAFTLVPAQLGALGIAIDSASIYWVSYIDAQILKANKDGTGVTVLATDTGGAPFDIALDATNVYWTDQGGSNYTDLASGTVSTCLKTGGAGGTALLPADLYLVQGLAVDQTSVYWAEMENSDIGRLNRADGGFGYLLAGFGDPSPNELAVDDASVYFTTSDGVQKTPKNGPLVYGDPTQVVSDAAALTTYYSSPNTGPWGITLDANNVYWTVQTAGLIQYAPRAGLGTGVPTSLASAEVNPIMITVDATNVYWTAGGPNSAANPNDFPQYLNGYVATCPKAGCPASGPTVLATGLHGPYGIAVDDTAIYFTVDGNIYDATEGSVMKVAK
jgi:hypothetical protein